MEKLIAHVRERAVEAAARLGAPGAELAVEAPRELAFGDATVACFPLSRHLRRPPAEIAGRLAAALGADAVIAAVEAVGPYVNLRFHTAALAGAVLRPLLAGAPPYGPCPPCGRTVVVDFSSPNIAKPFSVGLIRTTVIGAALCRIFRHLGWRVAGINHLGDWGSQFGKVLAALRRWGSDEELRRQPIRHTLELYVRYHQEEERGDATLTDEARELFRRLEGGDPEVRRRWREITDLSLAEFQRTYDRLGVAFDEIRGESFYEPLLAGTIARAEAAGIAEPSEGALIVRLDGEKLPPCLLRKSDGTTLYVTRDLAALLHRHEEYGFDRCLYVVGGEQKLHFQQLKAVIRRLGLAWADAVHHVDFGLIRFPDGRMSTRHGKVVFLDEVLDLAVARVRNVIAEKNPDLPDREAVAEAVGVGAVVFNDLKSGRTNEVLFALEEILRLEGETGPYVQYAGARLAGILRNGAAQGLVPDPGADLSLLEGAREVLHCLGAWGEALERAARDHEPSVVTGHCLRLARGVHAFLRENRVLGVEPATSAARLLVVAAARRQLAQGLALIGVASPDEM